MGCSQVLVVEKFGCSVISGVSATSFTARAAESADRMSLASRLSLVISWRDCAHDVLEPSRFRR